MPRKLTCSLKRSHFKIVKDRLPSHYCFKPTCQKLRFNLRIQYPRFYQKKKKRDQPQLLPVKKGEKNTNSPEWVGHPDGLGLQHLWITLAHGEVRPVALPRCFTAVFPKRPKACFPYFGVLGCWCSWSLGFIQLNNPNEATQTLRELIFVSFCKIDQLVRPCKGIQVDVVQV